MYYLSLFHGRTHPDESLDDWGTDGPIIGPFDYVSWTYGRLRFGTTHHGELELSDLHTKGEPDLIHFDGVWYGDFTILTCLDGCENDPILTLQDFNQRLEEYRAAQHFIQFPDYQI